MSADAPARSPGHGLPPQPPSTWRAQIAGIWNHHARLARSERGLHVELLDPDRLHQRLPDSLEPDAVALRETIPGFFDLATRKSARWLPLGVPTWSTFVGSPNGKRASWRDLASWDGSLDTEPPCGRRLHDSRARSGYRALDTAAFDPRELDAFAWRPEPQATATRSPGDLFPALR